MTDFQPVAVPGCPAVALLKQAVPGIRWLPGATRVGQLAVGHAIGGLPARERRGLHLAGKDNQPRLFDALDALPWRDVPVAHAATDRGHGRIETRARPQAIATLARGQRAIESLHWLRDTLCREDNSTVRTRSGPRAMATLGNLAVGALHLAGRHDTTEATRWASRDMAGPSPFSHHDHYYGRGQPLARGRAAIRKMDSTSSDAR